MSHLRLRRDDLTKFANWFLLAAQGTFLHSVCRRSLAHYRITGRLGAGGMGEVYRATDTKLGRDIALKVLASEVGRDPARLARFQREARALAVLNHPNVVTLYSVEEADGIHFITMEVIDGQPFDHLIPTTGLPVARITEIARALADALSAAHEKGYSAS
jgi:serine/threonine protein kinase